MLQVGYNYNDVSDAIEIYRDQLGGTPPIMRFVGGNGRITGCENFTTATIAGSFQLGGGNAQVRARTAWNPALSGRFGVSFENNEFGTFPVEFDWTNARAIFSGLNVGIDTTAPVCRLDVAGGPIRKRTSYTVATLPAASLGDGMETYVTDSNATLAAGHGNVVAGGGSNYVPVYSRGGSWRIG
jgi:hypothetical protein